MPVLYSEHDRSADMRLLYIHMHILYTEYMYLYLSTITLFYFTVPTRMPSVDTRTHWYTGEPVRVLYCVL